jgi:hypothetical protein
MTSANLATTGVLLIVAALGISYAGPSFGQTPAPPSPAGQAQEMPPDEYDRNSQLWAMQRAGFKSGWQRGQEIYYMRCWMCHNEYTIAADTAPPAPSLRDLFKRSQVAGQPVTDQAVAAVIRRGGARMPAYSAVLLSDADMTDLLTYLREKCGTFAKGGGCFDEFNPPPNPRYRAR